MEGPTPVSALIHAATMVTAGVYLVVRMHSLFILAPTTLQIIGDHWWGDLALCSALRAWPDRFEKSAGLFDRQPVGPHVFSVRGRRVLCSDVPFDHACLYQSASVPFCRKRRPHDPWHHRYAQDGRLG